MWSYEEKFGINSDNSYVFDVCNGLDIINIAASIRKTKFEAGLPVNF